MSEGIEAVKEAKEFVSKFKKLPDLIITDVPKETLMLFKKFANSDEFAVGDRKTGHYGFALKFLLDFYLGRITDGLDEVKIIAEEALSRVETLEQSDEKEEKIIRTLDGKELKVKK